MAKARENARTLVRDAKFQMAMHISYEVKQPIEHFMHWADKQQAKWNKARSTAVDEDAYACFGSAVFEMSKSIC